MLSRVIPSTDELLPVIGIGTYKNFDVHREKDICLRYTEREDAEAFLSIRFS